MHNYLGMRLDFGESGVCTISVPKYVHELFLEERSVTDRQSSPAPHNLYDVGVNMVLLPEPERQNFHSSVAKLLCIATRTRPDMLPLVLFLTTRVLYATEEDRDKQWRGLRYLNNTNTSMMGIRFWSSCDKRLRAYIDIVSHENHIDYGTCTFVHTDGVFFSV